MAIEISLKKGTANPTSGLTLAEPLFNSTNNTFWMGKGSSNTPVWLGAGICGASGGIAAGLTYQIPTLGAVKDYFSAASSSFIGTTSPYISSFNGVTGAVQGVSAIGVSGDWRTSSVVAFGSTGEVTLSGTTWSGQANPVLNTITQWGITAGTVLTGKTPMEILEIMLVQYLTPTLSGLNMGFVPASGSGTTSLAIGMTADNDTSNITWSTTNGTNITNGATLSVSLSSGVSGDSGTLLTTSQITSAVAGSYAGFNPTVKYKGTTFAASSSFASATFTLSARSTQNSSITSSQSYTWYPRIFYGWSTDPSLTYPPDSWKRLNVLSGLTTGSLMTSASSTNPNYSFTLPAPSTDSYLYFWIHSNYIPGRIMDATSGGNGWALTTDTSGTLVTGITLDDGITKQTYRAYRSQYTQVGSVTVFLTS